MLGLTVDKHQKSLGLPFQTQLLKKPKTQTKKTPNKTNSKPVE